MKKLSVQEWEQIHTDAELPYAGIMYGDPKKMAELLARSVLILSQEIRRLRLKYNEEVWWGIDKTDQDRKETRDKYHDPRMGDQRNDTD